MREKAREFFHEARSLAAAGKPNGAASRLYYSLYHAIIAVFEEKGINQGNLTNKVDPQNPGYWLHEVVRNNSTLAGVARRDASVIKELWYLRVVADYGADLVKMPEVLSLLARTEPILKYLGVKP